ncbi:MAG: hypothetical protein NC093_11615 [Alistipes sp.]|nr:hypothetical protein [Alistipes sp.]
MISYGMAKARAMAGRTDWNEREYISKAIITWVDSDYEYELEIENDGMSDEAFRAWIEADAEDLAKEDAAENGTVFEEVYSIDYETDFIDDDEIFDRGYEDACEFDWECRTGR